MVAGASPGNPQRLQESGVDMETRIDMENATPKKHSVRFDTSDTEAPVRNVYLSKWWIELNGGCPNGVRVTVEAL